jgi:hypothetical protein
MRTTLAALSFAAGLGVITCQSAAALPIDAGAIQQAAVAGSNVGPICRTPPSRHDHQMLS